MLLTVKQKIKSMFECKNISVGELLTQSNIFFNAVFKDPNPLKETEKNPVKNTRKNIKGWTKYIYKKVVIKALPNLK